jgi:hypothetical protein
VPVPLADTLAVLECDAVCSRRTDEVTVAKRVGRTQTRIRNSRKPPARSRYSQEQALVKFTCEEVIEAVAVTEDEGVTDAVMDCID